MLGLGLALPQVAHRTFAFVASISNIRSDSDTQGAQVSGFMTGAQSVADLINSLDARIAALEAAGTSSDAVTVGGVAVTVGGVPITVSATSAPTNEVTINGAVVTVSGNPVTVRT